MCSAGGAPSQDEPDLRDLLLLGSATGGGTSGSRSASSTAVQHVCGLLEVEPLHFVCHATSDGTRMERMDTGGYGATESSKGVESSGAVNVAI